MTAQNRPTPPETVRAIRSEYRPNERGHGLKALGKRYGLTRGAIAHIVKRRTRAGVE